MSSISAEPTPEAPVPAALSAVIEGRPAVPVWVNEIGGMTFRIGGDGSVGIAEEYVKWVPTRYAAWIADEAARLAWAGRWLRVPEVLDHDADEDGAWLRTRALPGWSAVDPRWRDEPRTAVVAVAEGLRALHDTLPVEDCPFTWSTADRAARAAAVGADPAALGPEPPTDRIVVCHGDPCTPNTLIGADRRWYGHVDLGALGVADRWADIAVATMALGWNHGPGWEQLFHEAYGVPFDPERTAWYRALWDLDDDGV
ncbi:aminoglycoside 3'-phosphotransferase [Curtobacterium sp. 9128]|uniref:aminoglycoside 3'-phosphotransferase n=1 Tax=Curtobacterium sp. 9128 TaxID=1793722 RepID=UPI0021B433DA|nr:aminoglycoside 3'-phosphotransferase [Curtobacterium sp. 9128]